MPSQKLFCNNDSYSNDELIEFLMKQNEDPCARFTCEEVRLAASQDGQLSSKINFVSRFASAHLLEPSNDQLIRHLRSF